uniref:Map1a/1b light chain 3b3 n=1 Tax=Rattus norvegicus TaxID=10116 RepID=Q6XVN6_RAT|nr:map1a/1b light chain 3b3 [Rattus norvegicus]
MPASGVQCWPSRARGVQWKAEVQVHSPCTWFTPTCQCTPTVFVRAVLTAVGVSPFHASTYMSALEGNSNRKRAMLVTDIQPLPTKASLLPSCYLHGSPL